MQHGINTDMEHDPAVLRQRAREKFLTRRTLQENKINEWHKSLLRCPKEKVLDKIPFDYTKLTLQDLVPEWYRENPDPAICAQQVADANEKLRVVNDIIKEINAEGVRLLEEYNAMK